MSSEGDKGFLSRWSQRKQEARQPEPKPDETLAEASPPPQPVAKSEAEPEFDLSSLPGLEELTGSTDITGFLAKGVPEHLRNAALRKSWALDPAIRNYVNPALEYAYDWNTPGGVPGSGELGAGIDIARMVSQIMGSGDAAAESEAAVDPKTGQGESTDVAQPEGVREPLPDLPTQSVRRDDNGILVAQNPETEAPQPEDSGTGGIAPQQQVRRHGSAKPVV
ncbi:MAG: DUF3306 domain-containing protein [Bradyrhizobium sp.]